MTKLEKKPVSEGQSFLTELSYARYLKCHVGKLERISKPREPNMKAENPCTDQKQSSTSVRRTNTRITSVSILYLVFIQSSKKTLKESAQATFVGSFTVKKQAIRLIYMVIRFKQEL